MNRKWLNTSQNNDGIKKQTQQQQLGWQPKIMIQGKGTRKAPRNAATHAQFFLILPYTAYTIPTVGLIIQTFISQWLPLLTEGEIDCKTPGFLKRFLAFCTFWSFFCARKPPSFWASWQLFPFLPGALSDGRCARCQGSIRSLVAQPRGAVPVPSLSLIKGRLWNLERWHWGELGRVGSHERSAAISHPLREDLSLGWMILIIKKSMKTNKNIGWTIDAFANTQRNFTLEAMARFFFKVASKLYSHPRFTAHLSHKLKRHRCCVSWLKKHRFIDMALGNSCFSKLVFDWKNAKRHFFLVSTYNTGDMYFKKIARNQFTSLVMWGVSWTSWDL